MNQLNKLQIPIVGVVGSYYDEKNYPPFHYVATDNYELVRRVFLQLKQKGLKHFAYYSYLHEVTVTGLTNENMLFNN